MSREALLEIVGRQRRDERFKDMLAADVSEAVKGYELTPGERDSLLRFLRGLKKNDSSPWKVIAPMIGRRVLLDKSEPWAFDRMPLADLFELAWAAGALSRPIPSLMKEWLQGARLSRAQWAEMSRVMREGGESIPDLTGPNAQSTNVKRQWGECLLAELEARLSTAEKTTSAAGIAESCAAVRRFLQGLM